MNSKTDMEILEKQEERTKQIIGDIRKEYTKSVDFLEDNTNTQLNIAGELKEELKNNDFDVNINEIKALKEEINRLKSEVKRLNEMENISLSSLIIKDIKATGNTLVNLQEKAVESVKHLYDTIKYQLSYNLTKAQEKFVQLRINVVKGLVASMQDFIKDQQRKLSSCLEKLDYLSDEIKKDEDKLNEKITKDSKEQNINTEIQKSVKKKALNIEKKPSVLKVLKENKQKIIQEEKGKEGKLTVKDKGMEI